MMRICIAEKVNRDSSNAGVAFLFVPDGFLALDLHEIMVVLLTGGLREEYATTSRFSKSESTEGKVFD